MTVSLRPVTKDNWRLVYVLTETLTVEQQHFVAPNGFSMLEALYEPDVFSARAIYAAVDGAETLVGFLMTGFDAENQRHWLVRFMIGGEHHRKGYGRAALQIVIDQFSTMSSCDALFVSVASINHPARAFYAHLGFLDTGRIIDEDCIYRLPLPERTLS